MEFLKPVKEFTTVRAILNTALGFTDKEIGTAETRRVAKILTTYGWKLKKTETERRWMKPSK